MVFATINTVILISAVNVLSRKLQASCPVFLGIERLEEPIKWRGDIRE